MSQTTSKTKPKPVEEPTDESTNGSGVCIPDEGAAPKDNAPAAPATDGTN